MSRLVDPSGRPLPSKEDEEVAEGAKTVAKELFVIVDAHTPQDFLNGTITMLANLALRMGNSRDMKRFAEDFVAGFVQALAQAVKMQEQNEKAHALLSKQPNLRQ